MKKKNNNFFDNLIDWTVKNKDKIIGGIIGLAIGLIIMFATEDPEIAKLENNQEPVIHYENGVITADDLYAEMKNYYSVGILLNQIDNKILTERYPNSDELNAQVNTTVNYWKNQAGEQWSTFLNQYGYTSETAFKNSIALDYRRTLAIDEYLAKNISDQKINNYYEENVYGDINTKHILVKPDTTSTMTENEINTKKSEALAIANEIITKLNEGKTFEEVKTEYTDKITYEELGYRAFNANLETNYLNEMKNLENNSYSKKPIETSYGYHIIYRLDQKEKPSLDSVKDTIKNILVTELKNSDELLTTKTLFEIRENDFKIIFDDSVLKTKYDEYKTASLIKK